MYEFLIGLTFDEAVAELDARGIYYDFGECETADEARECFDLYIGGLWSDDHYDIEDEDGTIVAIYEFEGWD